LTPSPLEAFFGPKTRRHGGKIAQKAPLTRHYGGIFVHFFN
jgi:hypothetical protein